MNLTRISQAQCDAIAERLNNRPRKRHDYRTPKEVFYGT
jgi:IS30 family transposase